MAKTEFSFGRYSYSPIERAMWQQRASSRNLPEVNLINTEIGTANIDNFLASQRRYYRIYHRLPSDDWNASLREEIFLANRQNVSETQMNDWNQRVRNVMFLFYNWAFNRFGKDDRHYDATMDVIDSYFKFRWDGQAESAIRYFIKMETIIPRRQFGGREVSMSNFPDHVIENKLLDSTHSVFEDSFLEEEKVTLGSDKFSGRSIFEDVPIGLVPDVIRKLPIPLYMNVALWRLGYLYQGFSSVDFYDLVYRNRDHTKEEKISEISYLVHRTKKHLSAILKKDRLEKGCDFITVSQLAQQGDPFAYYFPNGGIVRFEGIQHKLLARRAEIDLEGSYFRSLSSNQQQIIKLLLERGAGDYEFLYSVADLVQQLNVDRAVVVKSAIRAANHLFNKDILIDEKGRRVMRSARIGQMYERRQEIKLLIEEDAVNLHSGELELIKGLLNAWEKGFVHWQTYAEIKRLTYHGTRCCFFNLCSKIMDQLESG